MHLLKYRLIQTLRDGTARFWAMMFPIILGTLFYVSIWQMANGGMGEAESAWDAVPVSIESGEVVTLGDSLNAGMLRVFLGMLDNQVIVIHEYESDQARMDALFAGEIDGIYVTGAEPSLRVARSGISQSILKGMLDSYLQNSFIIGSVAREHPSDLPDALLALADRPDHIINVDAGGRTMNPNVSYFFALIAYACLSGAYLGVSASFESQANLSPLGARRSVTPTSKLTLILTDLSVLTLIHFVNTMALTLYLNYILKIPLGADMGALALTNLMGCATGVAIGIIIGSASKAPRGVKEGLTVLATLFPGFLAGLMYGNMKNIIEQYAPFINRINPAAVLADAYYSLSVFADAALFRRSMLILLAFSAALLGLSVALLRRNRYDSI